MIIELKMLIYNVSPFKRTKFLKQIKSRINFLARKLFIIKKFSLKIVEFLTQSQNIANLRILYCIF